MPDGLAALHTLGVVLDATEAQPFAGIRFIDGDVSVGAAFPEGYALGVRRTVLHSRMVEAAAGAGVRMLWGTAVSGICADGVRLGGETIRARWIAGADGFHSRVACWAGLAVKPRVRPRFGFRIHYRVAPWSGYMELHWGAGCQIYVTPIGPQEVCAALISRDPRLRLNDALARFPQLSARLAGAPQVTSERGAVTASRRLPRVYRGNLALIGDASGSVDAITGEGLCLSFRQALALADSLAAGDLSRYQAGAPAAGAASHTDVEPDVDDGPAKLAAPTHFSRHGIRTTHFSITAVFSRMRSHLLLTALAVCVAAWGQEYALHADPARSSVQFTLPATLHTVHGSFKLKQGAIRFDPAAGRISGEIVVDATSGNSGDQGRDRRMHEILDSAKYPDIIFAPDRVEGTVAAQGASQIQVHGTFRIHGAVHEITLPVEVRMNHGQASARTKFTIPYVKWGMKNPSKLFLRVGDTVEIEAATGALP